jgi:hypothetical protein
VERGAEDNGVALTTADTVAHINSYSFAGFSRIRSPRPLWTQKLKDIGRGEAPSSFPAFLMLRNFGDILIEFQAECRRVATPMALSCCDASLTSLIATPNAWHVCLCALGPNKRQLGLGRDQRPTRRPPTIRPCRRPSRGSHPLNGPGFQRRTSNRE